MGVRSDVAFCVTNKVYQNLSDKSKKTIENYFGGYHDRSEEGMFFYAEDVKWYHDCFSDLVNLYGDLFEQDDEGFHLIKACSDYPTCTDADIGTWYGNPWEISKDVSVSLHWYHRHTGQLNV